ncbi:hypothetical protein HRR83_005507 [Exophiala dermatitidis]|uniref:Uncharacterized protein n=1 Tax=Exophiala dermatitidis TaxID=5970 RepID=A0AAN6EWH9_EXODE|nr:hypothetical protein HRR74_005360 [Exophiala dermatitidis]KAJ4518391.1 hypothetical protein HRR73_003972 [Exophiala dermatitidis]KAJ4533884.1 hypothetical protein HRR76_005836 [Exophiala dermatitidis]KAJ4550040.1 hypothetical protein HRR77_003522 [Exophiala dermatitidis]KAJ4553388.1 hypothetical protein HRR79_009582 [Exophiala dermatitidis]
MSWKLAELRWRQDVGLQQSSWERGAGPQKGKQSMTTKDQDVETQRHEEDCSRHRPCFTSFGYGSSAYSTYGFMCTPPQPKAKVILPAQNLSVLSPGTSTSSTAPLLGFRRHSTELFNSSTSNPSPTNLDSQTVVTASGV